LHRRQALKLFAGLALCPLCAPRGFAADAHWSYAGANGPAKWGDLDAANRACSVGSQQSPIDIGTTVKAQLGPLKITWEKNADTIVNNGHTIQLDMGETSASVLQVGDGGNFRLVQFHFHHPSEHLVEGRRSAMEAHFVHQSADRGTLGVLGVFLVSGAANPAFARLAAAFPAAAGQEAALDGVDPNGLLPASLAYWSYEGSLTTPPCSEVVDWMVARQPVEVADADIARFAALYPMNARPVLADNRRFILSSP